MLAGMTGLQVRLYAIYLDNYLYILINGPI